MNKECLFRELKIAQDTLLVVSIPEQPNLCHSCATQSVLKDISSVPPGTLIHIFQPYSPVEIRHCELGLSKICLAGCLLGTKKKDKEVSGVENYKI